MMNKKFRASLAVALVLTLAGAPTAMACEDGQKAHIQAGPVTLDGAPVISGKDEFKGLTEVAAVPLKQLKGVPAITGDVTAHKGYAYVGTYRGQGTNEGVRIFDLKDPSHPVEISVMGNDLPGTWQEKVKVESVSTPYFKGDLAAFSVQKIPTYTGSDRLETGGVVLYDVSDPAQPKQLGFWKTPKELPTGTHEFTITKQGNRVLLLTTNYKAAQYRDQGVTVHDFSIIDITDPAHPVELANWDPRETGTPNYNGEYRFTDENGATRTAFLHSVIADETGKLAYLSYWDLGTIILNIEDPAHPKFIGRTSFDRNVQGAAHSTALAHGGNILIETREVFSPDPSDPNFERGWGYARIFDIKDKSRPKLISTFRTANSVTQIKAGERIPGTYTVHDPKVHGNTLYLSHYSDGIRMVDITNPAHPTEVASYVPSSAMVWGVYVDNNYILGSDMGSGLKVLKR